MTRAVIVKEKPPTTVFDVSAELSMVTAPSASDAVGTSSSSPRSQSWLENVMNQIPDLIYVKDLEGRFLFANQAIVANNGLSRLDDLVGRTDFDFLSAEVAETVAEVERAVTRTGQPHFGCEELAFRGDNERWLMITRVPLRDEAGEIVGVIGASRDITSQKNAARLKDAQSHLLEMLAHGTSLSRFLDEAAQMISKLADGLQAAFLLEAIDLQELHDPGAPHAHHKYSRFDRSTSSHPARNCFKSAICNSSQVPSREPRSAKELFSDHFPVSNAEGGADAVLCVHSLQDISTRSDLLEFIHIATNLAEIAIARHRAEAQIGYLADHDPLTGMANRSLLARRLTAALENADAMGGGVALAFLDLDNFKLVNDSLGHSAGDQLLKVVATRISALTNDQGSLARIGGDEFVVILEQKETSRYLERLSAIKEAVARPIHFDGVNLAVTCSIGVASYPADGKTAEELLACADMAMYRAKELGRDGVVSFSAEMAAGMRMKLLRSDQLRQALLRDEFVIYYQPQVHVGSGQVVGAEALIRWNHPTEGLVFPSDFIDLAEDAGLIVPMGEWVIRNACKQARAWQDAGLDPIRISVNVSARQFQENGIIDAVAKALSESGLEPEYLELEITESLIMRDLPGSVSKMHDLKELGVSLAIDDFGTGYSSLSALKKFPLSRLKIDRSFIAELPNETDDAAITAAIISLAQKLDLEVIAEGVETVEQARFLIEHGCHEIQGYLFSRPVSAEAFPAIVSQIESKKFLNAT